VVGQNSHSSGSYATTKTTRLTTRLFIIPQNASNTKKQGNHTKANKSGEEA